MWRWLQSTKLPDPPSNRSERERVLHVTLGFNSTVYFENQLLQFMQKISEFITSIKIRTECMELGNFFSDKKWNSILYLIFALIFYF